MVTPLLLWGLQDMAIIPEYEPFETGFLVIARTDNPCHLWLRFTGRKPRKHYRATVRRGLRTMKGTYRCFVTYRDIEQLEVGDTLIHKFHFRPIKWQDTKWFYLWGTMTLLESRSQSCLFMVVQRHRQHYLFDYYEPDIMGSLTFSYYRPQAQTITPARSFDLSLIRLRLRYYGFNRCTTIQIRDTLPGGEPGSNVLSSITYQNWPPDLIADGMGLKYIIMPTVRLEAGRLYAIVLWGDPGVPWDISGLWAKDFPTFDYPDGDAWNGYFDPPNAYWKTCPYPGGPWWHDYDHPFALFGNEIGF